MAPILGKNLHCFYDIYPFIMYQCSIIYVKVIIRVLVHKNYPIVVSRIAVLCQYAEKTMSFQTHHDFFFLLMIPMGICFGSQQCISAHVQICP